METDPYTRTVISAET